MDKCIITLQGAGTWPLSLEVEKDEWKWVESEFLRIKAESDIHPKVLFSSRKLCGTLRLGNLAPPTTIKVKNELSIQLEWEYKHVYLLAEITLDTTDRHDRRLIRVRPRD